MSLPDEFRALAKEQKEVANALIAEGVLVKPSADPNEPDDYTMLIAAIAGQVNATLYNALADMADHLRRVEQVNANDARLQARLKLNDQIRIAAAKGNWDEFDKLTGASVDTPESE